jgi:hypothetical protein
MSKKVTVTYTVTYNLRGQVLAEYLDSLEGYKDTGKARRWFAIDRFVGHDNLALFDSKAKLTVTEEDN